MRINTKRLRVSTVGVERTNRQEIESDSGRVLFSAPFRRLQSKAQVFSLESNAAVRSRLTHSLEVAHVGRYIVQKIRELALDSKKNDMAEELIEIETIVETSCLLHDIGNPPFGHLGEKAIQEWFQENAERKFKKSREDSNKENIDTESPHYKDFLNFDGNPQGLRICLTLQGQPGKFGFNLTYSQIASIIKYPRSSDDDFGSGKIGVFQTELESLKKIWTEMEIEWGKKHFLANIMEAADDIAYSLSDIEDGIEKKIVSESEILSLLRKEFEDNKIGDFNVLLDEAVRDGLTSPYIAFRTKMINKLVGCAARFFYEGYEGGVIEVSVFKRDDQSSKAIQVINKVCRDIFYRSAEAEDIEIAGYNVVYGLLNKFSILLTMKKEDFSTLVNEGKGKDLCRRVFSKIPASIVEHYKFSVSKDEANEWYYRFRMIVDYICGMTDDFALRVYRLFNGIEVKVL